MAVYHIKLKEQQEIAEHTKAFFFEKPKDFLFKAGQYLQLILLNPPETDKKGVSRFFYDCERSIRKGSHDCDAYAG